METTQDKSYFNVQQIKTCLENGITPYVPEPDKLARTRQQGRFIHNDFHFGLTSAFPVPPVLKK
ncbi:MAG TPA: hypothetical protein VF326_03105, partial [Anaerolineaceae bacterium]